MDKFKSKLSSWKANNLSFGGRITLVKSVLSTLPLYFFPLFKAPKKVIDCLEKIRRKFLRSGKVNNRKINWISWKTIVFPKEKGGLGVGCLRVMNVALLAKWV